MKKVIIFLCIVFILEIIASLRAQSDKVTERVLAIIPNTYKTVTFAYVAPDGETFVYAGQKDDGTAISFCGKEIATGLGDISKVNESGGILLRGTWNSKVVLVLNDKVFKTQAGFSVADGIQSLDVSPNGQHIAYLIAVNNTNILYVDGKLITLPFKYLGGLGIPNHALRINNEGLWAVRAVKDKKDYILIGNDRELGPFDLVGEPVFSPDGQHLAFFAHNDKKDYLVVNEKQKDVDGMLYPGFIVFSPDGRSICHDMNKQGHYYLAVDGENAYPYKRVVFKPQWVVGKWLYEVQSDDKKRTIVYGNQQTECEDLSELSKPVVSKDGKVIAYSGNISGLTFTSTGEEKQVFEGYIVLNGKREKALSCVMSFVLSANGRVVAYVAEYRKAVKDDIVRRQVAVIKNKPGKVYSSIDCLTCSDDGKRIAYIAYDGGKTFFVIGTQESEPFDQVWPPTFSDDGKKVTYAARKGWRLLWKVIEFENNGK